MVTLFSTTMNRNSKELENKTKERKLVPFINRQRNSIHENVSFVCVWGRGRGYIYSLDINVAANALHPFIKSWKSSYASESKPSLIITRIKTRMLLGDSEIT